MKPSELKDSDIGRYIKITDYLGHTNKWIRCNSCIGNIGVVEGMQGSFITISFLRRPVCYSVSSEQYRCWCISDLFNLEFIEVNEDLVKILYG